VRTDVQSESLVQSLEHTWEEPLVPEVIVRVGSAEAIAAVASKVAAEIDANPGLLLRWRGYRVGHEATTDDWHGGPLPALPAPARRPPDSVPKRFGTSGTSTPRGDLVEDLVAAYEAFTPSRDPS
jgi:hypothetical protein